MKREDYNKAQRSSQHSDADINEGLKAMGIDPERVAQNFARSSSRALLGFDTQEAVELIGLQVHLIDFFNTLNKAWKETPESTRSMLRLMLPEMNLVELLDQMDTPDSTP